MPADHTELRAFLTENERALAGYAKRLALGDDDLAREYYQQMCLNLITAGWHPDTADAPLAYAKRVLLNGVRDRARRNGCSSFTGRSLPSRRAFYHHSRQ